MPLISLSEFRGDERLNTNPAARQLASLTRA
jgi:hypothetical protein